MVYNSAHLVYGILIWYIDNFCSFSYHVDLFQKMATGASNEFEFDINHHLRPVWNSFQGWCNVQHCNTRCKNFNDYMKHWKMVHVEQIQVYACRICSKRFRKKERTVAHVGFIHRRRDASENVHQITVRNYSYKDTYGALPYRKGTPQERLEILQQEKEKEKQRRRRLAEEIKMTRGFED